MATSVPMQEGVLVGIGERGRGLGVEAIEQSVSARNTTRRRRVANVVVYSSDCYYEHGRDRIIRYVSEVESMKRKPELRTLRGPAWSCVYLC